MQDPKLIPQAEKKYKKKTGQAKATSAGLEGFMDWTNPGVSQPDEEEEVEMLGLVSSFSARMRKRVAKAKEGDCPWH